MEVEKILDYITGNCYDKGHGLLGPAVWVVDALSLLDFIRGDLGISEQEMRKKYDEARVRVHGEKSTTSTSQEINNDNALDKI